MVNKTFVSRKADCIRYLQTQRKIDAPTASGIVAEFMACKDTSTKALVESTKSFNISQSILKRGVVG